MEPKFRHLQCAVVEGVLVLTLVPKNLEGEETATEVRLEIQEAVDYYNLFQVVVNFQNTQYISSVAFRPLLSLRRKLQEVPGSGLVLCGLSPQVGDIFFTTRLISRNGDFDAPFEMEKDVAAAAAKLKGGVGAVEHPKK